MKYNSYVTILGSGTSLQISLFILSFLDTIVLFYQFILSKKYAYCSCTVGDYYMSIYKYYNIELFSICFSVEKQDENGNSTFLLKY